MKRRKLKTPEFIEVRGVRFSFVGAPPHWTENGHGELRCEKCRHPLVVLFAARELPGVKKDDPHWWRPTAVTCCCMTDHTVTLREVPHKPRPAKQDARQLDLIKF
jgi:hypothetical protein